MAEMAWWRKSSKRSISKDMTIGLILVVMIVSTIALITAYVISSRKAEAELNAKADEYILFLKNTLILPIWNYDFDTIDAVCRTYLQNELIAGVNVVGHRGQIKVDMAKAEIEPSTVRSATLTHYGIPIATVKISLAPGYLTKFNRQLFWSFSLTILINLAILLIMTGFMLRMALKRPLDRLNLIVDDYAEGRQPSFNRDIHHVEFRPLVNTLDAMGQKIERQVSVIRKAEQKYRGIFENAVEGIYQSTPSGRILSANPAFAHILGYATPEAFMTTVTDIGTSHWVDPDHRKLFVRQIEAEKVVSGFETRLRRRDGRVIWAAINARPIYDGEGRLRHFEGMVQDIDQRKKAEAQLLRLSTAVEQVADIIFITDDQGHIAYVNPAFEKCTGYRNHELIGQRPDKLAADDQVASVYQEIWETASKEKVWTGRLTNKRRNGEFFIVDTIVSPIKSGSGRFLGFAAVNRDVTDKVKFENQLRQAQKMEAMGTLAGGIAHDFNNILGVIIGCSELAMDNLPDDHIAKTDMEKVLDAGLRAKSLVRQILTFSRQTESAQKPLILQPFVKEVAKFLQTTLPDTVDIHLKVQAAGKAILADPTEIQQILMNLCTNAAQAMAPDGGDIQLSLEETEIDTKAAARITEINPGNYLKLTVSDRGSGIPEDVVDRIFDPFFTTKRVGEGTGLGLSVVHGIVKKYAGAILVESVVGWGTTFQVLLPCLEHPEFEIVSESASEPPGGREKILLVENEAVLAGIVQRILSGLGYEVKSFGNGEKAFAYFQKNAASFDLVLADQHMRPVDGIDLTKQIRTVHPTIPVILYSGMSNRLLGERAEKAGVQRLLAKPLNRLELAFEVRRVLDEYL
jgi:two-component system, cell cycle sensor histidine kinase and response regulator CckA